LKGHHATDLRIFVESFADGRCCAFVPELNLIECGRDNALVCQSIANKAHTLLALLGAVGGSGVAGPTVAPGEFD
jgi:hypothetical protein